MAPAPAKAVEEHRQGFVPNCHVCAEGQGLLRAGAALPPPAAGTAGVPGSTAGPMPRRSDNGPLSRASSGYALPVAALAMPASPSLWGPRPEVGSCVCRSPRASAGAGEPSWGWGTIPGPVSQVSGNCWISGAEMLL